MTALRRTKRLVHECRCERCGHSWLAFNLPKSCASCKSRSWNIPEGSVPLGRKPGSLKRPRKGEKK